MPPHPELESPEKKHRSLVIPTLDALLSLTFLVLAAYIAWYASTMSGKDGRDLLWYSALLGAYGVWRAIRSVIRHRQNQQNENN